MFRVFTRPSIVLCCIASVLVLAASSQAQSPQPGVAPHSARELRIPELRVFDPSLVDASVDPCNNFYQFSCKGWFKRTPLPADQTSYSRFTELYELNRKGIAPLQPELDRIAALRSKAELPALVAHLHAIGVNAYFNMGSAQDYAIESVPGVHLNGKLTLGENLADLGGLWLAWIAWQDKAQAAHLDMAAKTGGYTPEQRFWIAYAQQWCTQTRPESLRAEALTDPHAPDEYRSNGHPSKPARVRQKLLLQGPAEDGQHQSLPRLVGKKNDTAFAARYVKKWLYRTDMHCKMPCI